MSFNPFTSPVIVIGVAGLVAMIVIAYLWDRRNRRREYEAYVDGVKRTREFYHRKGELTDEDMKWLAEKDKEVIKR